MRLTGGLKDGLPGSIYVASLPSKRGFMRTLSVKTRVAGTSVAILAVSLGAVVVLIGASTGDSARRDAERITTETAARFAVQTQADLDGAFATARDLGTTLSALRATGGTREQADEIERTLLERHEPYLGVWSGWEADAFDGQDASYVSDPASDVSGRYITYWFRDGTNIESAPLVDYGTPGAGDYYQVPLRTGQEKILDPYEYDVAGTTVLMTSVTVPIIDEGEVVGVSGVDIALSQLQATMAEVQVYGTGSATLISTSGAVVASPETDSIGRPAAEAVLTLANEADGGVVSTTASTASGEVLRVAAPVTLTDQDTWVLVVDVPMTAVVADANRLRSTILLVGGLFLLLAAAGALLSARRLVRPIDVLQRRLTEISEGDGDLTQRVDDSRDDEIGALARAFNRFIEKVAGTVREIGTTSLELGASATSLQDVAARLQRGTSDTAAQTAALAAAGQQVDDSVQTVAAGIEEMGVSAGEIAGNATRAAQMASSSVAAAAATSATITSLATSSVEIGEVVKLITTIAAQTNLLALNATIEAARAGDSGKGFAVVAAEVKDLAQETSRATEDIAARVRAIQQDALRAGEALGQISGSIAVVDEEQTAIAAAVEQQAATVMSISRTISEAADSTAEMSTGIGQVDQMAAEASTAAAATGAAADGLERTAQRLRDLVGDFRC